MTGLVFAAATCFLMMETANASPVEVVRPDPLGFGWIAVTGDLETPDGWIDPVDRWQESAGENPLHTPVAPSGVMVGRWAKENFGPIFADVLFSKAPAADLRFARNSAASILFQDQSLTDDPGGGGVVSGSIGPLPFSESFNSVSGTVSGEVPGSISGEITGTTGGSVDIVLTGQLDGVSSVPLPGASWLFITGLAGWVGYLNHKPMLRILHRSKITFTAATAWFSSGEIK